MLNSIALITDIYCSHDDEYLTRIYMDVKNYMDVIEFISLSYLKQKNKVLFQLCQSGIIFNFEQNLDRIKFYVVQEETKIDDIYKKIVTFRKQGNGWNLAIKNNEWTLENECN